MITVRKSGERGYADNGWLKSYHTFSFANYHDPRFMGFSALRVINEDVVVPSMGFPTHGHRDMEIVTYVLSGALEHKDSMGNGSIIRPGEVQRMSAGTGVTHSEYNASASENVHLLQIWILPAHNGIAPGYEQKTFTVDEKAGKLRLVASPDGSNGSVTIHQNARIYAAVLDNGQVVSADVSNGRNGWVQMAKGSAKLNDIVLNQGDGAAVTRETRLMLTGTAKSSELLLFDLP